MGKKSPVWADDANVQALIKFNSDGFSSSIIAEKIGLSITKNAVISKLRQLGIKMANPPTKSMGSSRGQRKVKPPADNRLQERRPPIPLPSLVEAKDIIPIGLSLMDLTDRHCHWPTSELAPSVFAFCGHPATHGPYCGSHAAIAYPPQKTPATGRPRASGGMRGERQFHT